MLAATQPIRNILGATRGRRSPAPPAIALVGLLGMLIGEQVVPLAKRAIHGEAVSAVWFKHECAPKITGVAPQTAPRDNSGEPT